MGSGPSKTGESIPARGALEKACRLAAGRQYTQAAQYFEEALVADAAFPALCGTALCLYKTGRLREALEAAARAVAAKPARGEPHFIAGLAHKDAGDYPEAVAAFQKAIDLGYSRAAALYQRAAARFLAGELEAAQRDFEEVTRLRPESAAAFYNLGVVLVHRCRWKDAASAFSACATIDPSSGDYYHEMIFSIGRAQAGEEFHFRGHRIKNMLALLADTWNRDLADAPSEGSGEIASRIERALAEMSELLSFVRRDPLELDVWDVHDGIEMALLRAADALSDVKVEKRFAPDIPALVCDAQSLNEAFITIILNAAEARPGGGVLRVVTARDVCDGVCVAFEDTGGGIEADPTEKVFQFAFTTRARGTGLGLCQAARAVEEHGGVITAENAGGGARFVVALPLSARAGERIQDIGLRPDLSDDISLFFERGTGVSIGAGVNS